MVSALATQSARVTSRRGVLRSAERSWTRSRTITWHGDLTGTARPASRRSALHRAAAGVSTADRLRIAVELVITAANGQQSIDTVTVTIGGKAPTPIRRDRVQHRSRAAIDNG